MSIETLESHGYLALCYFIGKGKPKDEKEAAGLFAKIEAIINRYEQSRAHNELNLAEAKSTEKSHIHIAKGKFFLGYRLEHGIGVAKNKRAALELYKESANHGCAVAQCYLGQDTMQVMEDLELNDYIRKAAKQEYPPAQFSLATVLLKKNTVQDVKEAMQWLEKSVAQKYARAECQLGMCLLEGRGVAKDEKAAIELFQKSASKKYARAECQLANCLLEGRGIAKDEKAAIELFQKSAAQKYARAEYELGICLLEGIGIAKDEKAGVELFQKSVAQKYAAAEFRLGMCLLKGVGIAKDEKAAIELFQQSAAQNYAPAECQLSFCLLEGTGIAKDEKAAVQLLQKSAAQKYAPAEYTLGACLLEGIGIAQDEKAGVELFQKSVAQKYAAAEFRLGMCLLKGVGIAKDEKAAIELFQQSAAQNYAPAECQLSFCLLEGTGIAKDEKAAVQLLQKSAAQKYAPAEYTLGACLLEGIGIAQDRQAGIKLLQKSVAQKYAAAEYELGNCLFKGIGIAKDEKAGIELFKKSVAQKYAQAECQLSMCLLEGRGIAKDEKAGMELLQKSAAQGYPPAEYELGVCLLEGRRITENEKAGIELLKRSVVKNYAPAEYELGSCLLEGRGIAKDEKATAQHSAKQMAAQPIQREQRQTAEERAEENKRHRQERKMRKQQAKAAESALTLAEVRTTEAPVRLTVDAPSAEPAPDMTEKARRKADAKKKKAEKESEEKVASRTISVRQKLEAAKKAREAAQKGSKLSPEEIAAQKVKKAAHAAEFRKQLAADKEAAKQKVVVDQRPSANPLSEETKRQANEYHKKKRGYEEQLRAVLCDVKHLEGIRINLSDKKRDQSQDVIYRAASCYFMMRMCVALQSCKIETGDEKIVSQQLRNLSAHYLTKVNLNSFSQNDFIKMIQEVCVKIPKPLLGRIKHDHRLMQILDDKEMENCLGFFCVVSEQASTGSMIRLSEFPLLLEKTKLFQELTRICSSHSSNDCAPPKVYETLTGAMNTIKDIVKNIRDSFEKRKESFSLHDPAVIEKVDKNEMYNFSLAALKWLLTICGEFKRHTEGKDFRQYVKNNSVKWDETISSFLQKCIEIRNAVTHRSDCTLKEVFAVISLLPKEMSATAEIAKRLSIAPKSLSAVAAAAPALSEVADAKLSAATEVLSVLLKPAQVKNKIAHPKPK